MDIKKITDSVKFLFDQYKGLKILPLYAWGRYYMHELRGESFETDGYTFGNYKYIIPDERLNWPLLRAIDRYHRESNDRSFQVAIGDIIQPSRKECIKEYGFDSSGGIALLVIKGKKGELTIEAIDCESPE